MCKTEWYILPAWLYRDENWALHLLETDVCAVSFKPDGRDLRPFPVCALCVRLKQNGGKSMPVCLHGNCFRRLHSPSPNITEQTPIVLVPIPSSANQHIGPWLGVHASRERVQATYCGVLFVLLYASLLLLYMGR